MSIETAIKVFDPRTLGEQGRRSRPRLPWDEIAGILARLERDNPTGYRLIMLKFRDDHSVEPALRADISAWVVSLCTRRHISSAYQQNIVYYLAQTALDILTHKPLSTQARALQHLHRLHGGYARREATRIKKLRKLLLKEQSKPESRQRSGRIRLLAEQIDTTREHINHWVIAHAAASTQCPRCKGAGVITLPRHMGCPACAASGWIVPTPREIIRHIGSTTGKAERFLFVIDECYVWLSMQIGITVSRMNELFDMNTSEPV